MVPGPCSDMFHRFQVVQERGETSPIQIIDGFVDIPVLLQRQKEVLVQKTVEVRQAQFADKIIAYVRLGRVGPGRGRRTPRGTRSGRKREKE